MNTIAAHTDTSTVNAELHRTVSRWVELDPDPVTRQELVELVSAADAGDETAGQVLAGLFAGRLAFGTAGLRAELGPGPLRMNRLVVRQTAAGLLQYATAALSDDSENGQAPVIVIGYDARHQSDEFAAETAQIFLDAGWQVYMFDQPGPTPLLARQVMVRHADVGVMVTASHNPPRDNGYKAYLGGRLSRTVEPSGLGVGAQIVSPVDLDIAGTIAGIVAQDFALDSPTPAALADSSVPRPAGVLDIDQQDRAEYQREALELLDPEGYPHRDLRIVYTAMHGVGGEAVTSLLQAAGFENVFPVAEQFAPDPDFPTADFPNPEEAGALDLALAAAQQHSADLVLANDPDADRLSAAVFDAEAGSWRQLNGDEIGALLGRHIMDRGPLREGWQTPADGEQAASPVFSNSVVSSRLLGKLAAARGFAHEETLTGFKWLARVPHIVFGYEEAIGFDVDPAHVRDKDGVSAALIFAELMASLKAQGISAVQALDEIAAEAGVHVTAQVTVKVSDLSQLGAVTSALRSEAPTEIAGAAVVETLDLSTHPLPGKVFAEATSTDALIYLTASGDRVIVRPSGTEPKVKCYLEAVAEPESAEHSAVATARGQAKERLEQLRTAMTELLG